MVVCWVPVVAFIADRSRAMGILLVYEAQEGASDIVLRQRSFLHEGRGGAAASHSGLKGSAVGTASGVPSEGVVRRR